MSKRNIIFSSILISIIVTILLITGFYFILINYIFSPEPWEKVGPWITKIKNQKVIEEKVKEYRKISNLQNDITNTINKSMPSVVNIVVTKNLRIYYEDPYNFFGWHITKEERKIGGGSWIIVSSDGYIITNKHVVEDLSANYTVITSNWENYKVSKIWKDPVLDLAILKIVNNKWQSPTDLNPASIKPVDENIKIGQFVVAIGNALSEFQNTATFGIISGKGRKLDQTNDSIYMWLYQTDAPINPGNSWGPLLDINWEVLGINTAITSVWQWIGFALPINKNLIQSTIDVIKEKEKIIRPFIGVKYVNLNKSIAKNLDLKKFKGALIKQIVPWSPADRSNLQKWDIILEINWESIDKNKPFLYRLYTYKPWETIKLTVYSNRKKDYKKVELKLGERN